jgi:arylsulfatase A-like enzyme
MENAESHVPRRAVVLTFDHLHAGFLGCYGNDWIETPNLDRLASQAVVFDRHYCENLDPAAANHAWWTGRYQFPLNQEQQRAEPAILSALHAAGVRTRLFIESDESDDVTVAPPFDDVSSIRGTDGFEVVERETPLARVVGACEQWLTGPDARSSRSVLLWIKSRGIPSPWVPPRVFADLYLEEFGLAAARDDEAAVEPGDLQRDEEESPLPADSPAADDSLDWRYGAAMYAAYVTLVDRWVGKLLGALDSAPGWNAALLIVTAGAGQVLGEHGRLADAQVRLRAECLHTPFWLRLPGSDQAGTRRQALIQTTDLAPTLLSWFGAASETQPATDRSTGHDLLPLVCNQRDSCRDFALTGIGRQEWGIRTHDFFYVEPGDVPPAGEQVPGQLFEKPRDRWDQSNVITQQLRVADELRAVLQDAIRRISESHGSSRPSANR